jgi:hypothetical protein
MKTFNHLPIREYIKELELAAKLATSGKYALARTPSGSFDELANRHLECLKLGTRDHEYAVLAWDHPQMILGENPEMIEHAVYVSMTGNGPNSENNAIYQSYLSPDNVLLMIDYIKTLEEYRGLEIK